MVIGVIYSLFTVFISTFLSLSGVSEVEEETSYYAIRERRVLESRIFNQFYILNENINDDYIEEFNQASVGNFIRIFHGESIGTMYAPATFENTRKKLLNKIDYHNLNPNLELDEGLKESWSEGSIKTIKQEFTPVSRDANGVVGSSRYGRIRVDKNTTVRLVYWHLFTTVPTFHNPYFSQRLWEFVEILDGEHAGTRGWVLHYYLI